MTSPDSSPYRQDRDACQEAERTALKTIREGDRVRYRYRKRRLFSTGPETGEGTVTLVWAAMGEPTWDIRVEPSYEEAVWGDVQPITVSVNPGFGDVLELATESEQYRTKDDSTGDDQ